MAEYIEREAAKDELLSWAVCINHPEHLMREDAIHVLDAIPAADVAQVVHGRWIRCEYMDRTAKCSACNTHFTRFTVSESYPNYCPNCGANMDGDHDD